MIIPKLQIIINHIYRYPLSNIKKLYSFGGPLKYSKMLKAQNVMRLAAESLAPSQSYSNGYPVYFLTGKFHFHQTLFCIASLVKCTTQKFKFVIADDGSFDSTIKELIEKKVPGCIIVSADELNRNVENIIPAHKFPALHNKRSSFTLIKKLTDIHTIQADEWKLFLDSDMLFWHEPTQLINWLSDPAGYLYMVDIVPSYGYSRKLMEELCGATIPEKLNSGMFGTKSSSIDWNLLETWIKELEEKENSTYLLEQALTAMLVGSSEATVLKKEEYIVLPNNDEIKSPKGVLHHYVNFSKRDYIIHAWKQFI